MSDNGQEFWRWTEIRWSDPDKGWRDAKVLSSGVDVGSVSTQAVVMADGEICAYSSVRTGYNSPESATNAINLAMDGSGLTLDKIHYSVGTGYGRVKVPFANKAITEIACHARGANFMYGPSVRTILDMGGQDLKVIHCDERGKVENFLMNDKCAAGTGRGMEIIADLLQVPIEEIGDRSFDVVQEPDAVSNMCVLFAKTEVMGLLHEGVPTNTVLAAYCRAMADRVVAQVKELGVREKFAITGGIAKNRGVVERVEKGLGVVSVKAKVDYQLAGAIGAALFGKFLYEKGKN